jgi:glycosyltransferase involved in cell wall biosynthesis
MVFTSVWMDLLVPALDWVASTAVPSVTNVLKVLWNDVLVPLGKFVGSVLTPIIEILSDVLTWLWQYVVVPLAECVGGVLAAAWENLALIFEKTVLPIVGAVISVFQFLWDSVLGPLVDFLWDIFEPVFDELFVGIGDLIKSVETLLTGLLDFVGGVFTGEESIYQTCEQYIRQHQIDNIAIMLGVRKDVLAILQHVDGFLYATKTDTFGIAVVEAMLCGVPVIVNDFVVMKEITQNGKFATLYKSKDINDCAHKILDFIENMDMYKQQAQAQVYKISELYSVNNHINNLLNIYTKL